MIILVLIIFARIILISIVFCISIFDKFLVIDTGYSPLITPPPLSRHYAYIYTTASVRDSSISTHTRNARTINVYCYFFLWRNFPCVHVHTSEVPTCFIIFSTRACRANSMTSTRRTAIIYTHARIHTNTIQFVVVNTSRGQSCTYTCV